MVYCFDTEDAVTAASNFIRGGKPEAVEGQRWQRWGGKSWGVLRHGKGRLLSFEGDDTTFDTVTVAQ